MVGIRSWCSVGCNTVLRLVPDGSGEGLVAMTRFYHGVQQFPDKWSQRNDEWNRYVEDKWDAALDWVEAEDEEDDEDDSVLELQALDQETQT